MENYNIHYVCVNCICSVSFLIKATMDMIGVTPICPKDQIVSLQSMLLQLDRTNFSSTVRNLVNSAFVKEIDKISLLVHEIFSHIAIQMHHQTCTIDLLLELFNHIENSNLKEAIFDEIMSDHPISVKKIYFYTLKCLLNRKIFEFSEIEEFITQYKHCSRDELFVLFYTFAHELSENKSDVYSIYNVKFQNRFFFNSFDVILVDYDKYRQNNWELLEKHLEEIIIPNSIQYALTNDDLIAFQNFCLNPNFDVNESIFYSIFYHHDMLVSATPIEIAAFFGSINIFKFLILGGAKVNERLVHYAVAGGNLEIIRICEQSRLPISGSLETAVIFRKNSIIQWIVESYRLTKNEIISALTQAAIWDSFIAYDTIINVIKNFNAEQKSETDKINVQFFEAASEKAIENGHKCFGFYITQNVLN